MESAVFSVFVAWTGGRYGVSFYRSADDIFIFANGRTNYSTVQMDRRTCLDTFQADTGQECV